MNDQIDLSGPSQIGFEAVALWRFTFQSDALTALHGIADFHAAIGEYLGIDDAVTDLELGVAIANLHLHIAVKTSGPTVPVGWNLQKHPAANHGVIRVFKGDAAPHLIHCFRLP